VLLSVVVAAAVVAVPDGVSAALPVSGAVVVPVGVVSESDEPQALAARRVKIVVSLRAYMQPLVRSTPGSAG
jgi:protein-L-isoaspartate O-methyltransferase